MFPRISRLVNKKDFQFVFAQPFKKYSCYLRAFYRSNRYSHARLGIIVAKAIIKRAVDRNLIRRMVRESFREHQEALKGLDIVVVIRSKCNPQMAKQTSIGQTIDKQALRDDIDQLWRLILVNSSKLD